VPLTETRALLDDRGDRDDHRAVAAFNVVTLEHAEGIVAGAESAAAPVILQVSQNAIAFHGGAVLPLVAGLIEIGRASSVPIALHLDHVEDPELVRRGAVAGFSSVMVDAGRLPYEQNVAETARQTRWLKDNLIFVEAELGYVGGKQSQVQSAHAEGVRTDPQQAAEFIERTGVDALAVAVGSSHAMTAKTARLDVDLITRLREGVPVPLVLHGSSGVPDDELAAAVHAGIRKVNIGTALNVAFTAAVRDWLAGHDSVDPRAYLAEARAAIRDVVTHLIGVVSGA
jgi:fructose-bisphosphate aldolase class II